LVQGPEIGSRRSDRGKLQLLKHLPKIASETSAGSSASKLGFVFETQLADFGTHGAISSPTMHPIREKFAGTMRSKRCSAFIRSRREVPESGRDMTIAGLTQDNTFLMATEFAQHTMGFVCGCIVKSVHSALRASWIPGFQQTRRRSQPYEFRDSFPHTSPSPY
jgi:hypothetical protein